MSEENPTMEERLKQYSDNLAALNVTQPGPPKSKYSGIENEVDPCVEFIPSARDFDLTFNYASQTITNIQVWIVEQITNVLVEISHTINDIYNDFSSLVYETYNDTTNLIYSIQQEVYLQLANIYTDVQEQINNYTTPPPYSVPPSPVEVHVTCETQPAPPPPPPPPPLTEPPPRPVDERSCPTYSSLEWLNSGCAEEYLQALFSADTFAQYLMPMAQEYHRRVTDRVGDVFGIELQGRIGQ